MLCQKLSYKTKNNTQNFVQYNNGCGKRNNHLIYQGLEIPTGALRDLQWWKYPNINSVCCNYSGSSYLVCLTSTSASVILGHVFYLAYVPFGIKWHGTAIIVIIRVTMYAPDRPGIEPWLTACQASMLPARPPGGYSGSKPGKIPLPIMSEWVKGRSNCIDTYALADCSWNQTYVNRHQADSLAVKTKFLVVGDCTIFGKLTAKVNIDTF